MTYFREYAARNPGTRQINPSSHHGTLYGFWNMKGATITVSWRVDASHEIIRAMSGPKARNTIRFTSIREVK
jgi:hypothetical protein